jgi:hypothetical protein
MNTFWKSVCNEGVDGIIMNIFRPLSVWVALIFLAGCAAKIPHTIVPDYAKRGTSLIAVMPASNAEADPKSAGMLRAKLAEELYFKGYPKLPLKAVDEALAGMPTGAGGKVSPQSIGERLKVDAVLYTTVYESRTSRRIIYAPTTVDAQFELLSTKTGESLWRVRYRITKRNYGFTQKQLELKSSLVYEEAIHEVVNRALETLPDGPDGIAPPKAEPQR